MIDPRFDLLPMNRIDLAALQALTEQPPLFEPGEPRFWDDPHIAKEMLAAHLNPDWDAASRKPAFLDASTDWIITTLGLKAGDSILDLGCGPGLYCQRFNAHGLTVTGVDLSANSLDYARRHDPATTYILADYRSLEPPGQFDAVVMIYGDFCVLSDPDRDAVLNLIHRALKPGGHFVFDVSTRPHHAPQPATWSVHPNGGFWKPGPHLTLYRQFDYPAQDAAVEQYIVIEADGATTVYRNWFHYYDPDTLAEALSAAGFTLVSHHADLTGRPYSPYSEWLAAVARRA